MFVCVLLKGDFSMYNLRIIFNLDFNLDLARRVAVRPRQLNQKNSINYYNRKTRIKRKSIFEISKVNGF